MNDAPPKSNIRLFFSGLALALFFFLALEMLLLPLWWNLRFAGWPTERGRMLAAEARPWGEAGGGLYVPKVEFTYEREGRTYTGTRFAWRDTFPPSAREDVAEVLDGFPVGAEVVCYVDPSFPGRAFLVRPANRHVPTLLTGGVALLAAAGALAFFVRELRREYLPHSDHW